jgi:hypothetical protein
LAQWEFELFITQTASGNYTELRKLAEAAVFGYEGPLPMNSDPRLVPRLSAINHFERTRKILRSIRNPDDVNLDIGISGPAHFVSYRAELGTCVYFTRIVTSPPAVLIYAFSDEPLDFLAIRKIVFSGDAELLTKMGLPSIILGGSDLIN